MSRCLVVMQPTFLPWPGYFNLMSEADDFVFLDDVQLEKQSWQTRNRLLFSGAPCWVSVPVRHTNLAQTIQQTEILDSSHWRAKLARGFALNYSKHPYYDDAGEVIEELVAHPGKRLAELNEAVIRLIAKRLQLTPAMHRASDTHVAGERSDRLIDLCRTFSAGTYLSPLGSADYLSEDGFSARSSVQLRFQDYSPKPYPQRGVGEFHSHLSTLDVIANMGWNSARNYVLNGTSGHE